MSLRSSLIWASVSCWLGSATWACSSADSPADAGGAPPGAGGAVVSGGSSSGGNSSGGGSTGGTSATPGGASSGGSTTTGGSSPTGGAATGGGAGVDVSKFWGTFTLSLNAEKLGAPAFTGVLGVVYDRFNPPRTVPLKVQKELNGCQLLVPQAFFCSSCPSETGVCTAEEVCTPNGKPQNLGNVKVSGLKPADFVMEPFPPGFDYQPTDSVPNPACDEGAPVGVETSSFRIQGTCISQLVLEGPETISVRAGQPVAVRWKAPSKPELSKIAIHLDIAHHGGKKGEINCEVPDNGSFDIPEPLVTDLVSLGLAGFPTIEVTRRSEASADKAPQVKLVFASEVERNVDTGVNSCSSDTDCSGGKTCKPDKTCG
ncbi:MAG TPA: hypothetical protein VFQ61_23955 [Polyangiaceae bacterium]|nr:hypothetical protein [Polyangiaceae bacterium]